jgi:purine-binding chemotaxis protein CheW
MQACTFHVGEFIIAIPTEDIREIAMPQAVTPLPLSPPVVRGLTHMRGDIHVAIDLHAQLGQPETDPDAASSLQVILTEKHGTIALLVDAVGDLVEITKTPQAFTPETLVVKTATDHNGDVLLLNVEQAINPLQETAEK